MVKIYETRERTTELNVLVKRVCDLCGFEAKGACWNRGIYKVEETEVELKIRHRSGESYPEGSWGKEYDIDLCPECFVDKLVPWLRSQGAEIAPEDYDH